LTRRWTEKEVSFGKMEKSQSAKKTSGLGVKDLGKMNVSLLCKWW